MVPMNTLDAICSKSITKPRVSSLNQFVVQTQKEISENERLKAGNCELLKRVNQKENEMKKKQENALEQGEAIFKQAKTKIVITHEVNTEMEKQIAEEIDIAKTHYLQPKGSALNFVSFFISQV